MTATAGERPYVHRSTSDVAAAHALAYWIEAIGQSLLEVDIDSSDRDHFHAQLEQRDFGPAALGIVEAHSQSIRRTRARIARSRHNNFFLLHMRAGRMRYQQYGRETFVQTGDCVLVDGKEPYQQDCPEMTRCVVFRFPENWLRNWLPAPEDLVARSLSPTAGWGSALTATLANLDTDMEVELALPDSIVAEQVAALLALAAGPTAHAKRRRDRIRGGLLRTLRNRCYEADLTPKAIAADHGISKRHLHHLFAQANTTFGEELMRARLANAHRLLSDKRYDAVSVTEVAARCGFVTPSHFARRFRMAYGLTPTQFRSARWFGLGHPFFTRKPTSRATG